MRTSFGNGCLTKTKSTASLLRQSTANQYSMLSVKNIKGNKTFRKHFKYQNQDLVLKAILKYRNHPTILTIGVVCKNGVIFPLAVWFKMKFEKKYKSWCIKLSRNIEETNFLHFSFTRNFYQLLNWWVSLLCLGKL